MTAAHFWRAPLKERHPNGSNRRRGGCCAQPGGRSRDRGRRTALRDDPPGGRMQEGFCVIAEIIGVGAVSEGGQDLTSNAALIARELETCGI